MLIGVDFGGTKIEAIALSDGGATLERKRVPTPRDDYESCVATVASLVCEFEGTLGATGSVGVGIPGMISPATGLVKNANSTWLIGRPLRQDLERALEREIRVENDANCLAVSEAVDGAGAGASTVWAVILGTGVGSGIARDGLAIRGRNAIAGEWGHNPLPWPEAGELPGPPCYCGRRGCIETFLSGPGFALDYADAAGRAIGAEAIVAAARDGKREALEALGRYASRLARGLAHVVNILDPDVIVLAGGMSDIAEIYADLQARVGDFVFSDTFTTPIVKSAHGPASGVRGAAWLWQPALSVD